MMPSVYALSIPVDLTRITSTTKPTTRVDGSALQANDLWRDTTSNLSWFFSGSVWRSAELQSLQINLTVASAHNALPKAASLVTHVYIETYSVAQQSSNGTANNASNYRNMNVVIREKVTTVETLVATIQNFPLPLNQANRFESTVNTAYLLSTYSGLLYRDGALVGTDGAYLNFVPVITYRWQFA